MKTSMPNEDLLQLEDRARKACWLWGAFHVLWWLAPTVLLAVNFYLAMNGRLQVGFGVVSALLALCAAVLLYPRPLPAAPAGMKLQPDAFPELHREIGRVAKAMGHPAPGGIFLVPGGDIFLVHSPRRPADARLYVGAALFSHLSRGEFLALAAQEFGRFSMQKRPACGRVVQLRQQAAAHGHARPDSLLHHLYLGFMSFYIRLTHAIARRQELEADAESARLVGGEALVSALRRWVVLRPGFEAFWNMEVAPVLDAGYRPPLMEGFSLYMASAPVQEIVREVTTNELRRVDEDESEVPPPLSERIRFVQAYVSSGPPNDTTPAHAGFSLDLGRMEPELLAASFPPAQTPLTPISWPEVLSKVLWPHYREIVAEQGSELAGIRMDELCAGAWKPADLLDRIVGGPVPDAGDDGQMRMLLGSMLGPVLCAAFYVRGAELECIPGEPVRVLSAPPLQPFLLFEDMHAGRLRPEAWDEVCRVYGLSGCDLGELCAEILSFDPATGRSVPESSPGRES